ncbi:lipoprotein [Vibrio sp. 10N.247.311.26]
MKKALIAAGIITMLAGCSDNEVGDVSLGFFTMKDAHTFTQLLYTLNKF